MIVKTVVLERDVRFITQEDDDDDDDDDEERRTRTRRMRKVQHQTAAVRVKWMRRKRN